MAIEIRIGGECVADMPHLRGVRHTLNRSVVAWAFHGVPDWVEEIGSSGTVHSLDTCDACATAYYLRWVWRQGTSEQACETLEKEYETNKREQNEAYKVPEGSAESHAMVTEAQGRQVRRIMRAAARCPVRRLPEMMRELTAMMRTHEVLGHEQSKHLVRASAIALDIARSRWEHAQADALDAARLRILRSRMN